MVNSGGKGLHTEKRNRAKIGNRLHRDQQNAAHGSGPRHRQRDTEEDAQGVLAQGARNKKLRRALAQKRGPRQQIDVRIQNNGQHRCRPAK